MKKGKEEEEEENQDDEGKFFTLLCKVERESECKKFFAVSHGCLSQIKQQNPKKGMTDFIKITAQF